MNQIEWHQSVRVHHEGREVGFLKGPAILLPCSPFPGLCVGALVVFRVYVNQGEIRLDSGEIEYQPVGEEQANLLTDRGWIMEETEAAAAAE